MWGQQQQAATRTKQRVTPSRRIKDDTAPSHEDSKAHVTSFKAVDLREQLQMVAYPVAVEVVLSVADRYFLAWKAAMLASSEVTGDDLLTLIDQFVFCKNGLVLTSPFDELQLLDVIRKHLSQQHDVQDDDKMRGLHQLTSFMVTAANGSGMDCVANWMKLHPTEALEIADKLYHDFCVLLPHADEPFMMIGKASPHLAYRLLLAYTIQYPMNDAQSFPPITLVRAVLRWLTDCPKLFTDGEGHTHKLRLLRSRPLNPEATPLAGLIQWSTVGPIEHASYEDTYSDFHYKLLVAIGNHQSNKSYSISGDQLIVLAYLLLKHAGNRGVDKAVDRLAQILQVCVSSKMISTRSAHLNTLLSVLPSNRLLNMVVLHNNINN
ncbi:integrator complex subunit 15-like isoform X2 [Dysidea avara]|uniref:integrator complex subunit 15-like isoform X2 n=1 Tax=Dysidea avara TaxID=196820 RepID=UPI00331DC70F